MSKQLEVTLLDYMMDVKFATSAVIELSEENPIKILNKYFQAKLIKSPEIHRWNYNQAFVFLFCFNTKFNGKNNKIIAILKISIFFIFFLLRTSSKM